MKKVLLVDDEDYILEMLSRMIPWDFYGYEIIGKAGNASDAMKIFYQTHLDLIITDICMEDISGIDFITRIRMMDPNVKILILSAYDKFEYAQKAMKLNVDGYLLKPLNRDELTGMLVELQKEMTDKAQEKERIDTLQNSLNYYQEKYLEEELLKLYSGTVEELPKEISGSVFWCVLSIEALVRSEIIFLEQDIREHCGVKCYSFFVSDGCLAMFLNAKEEKLLVRCLEDIEKKYAVSDRNLLVGRSYIDVKCDQAMCENSRQSLRMIFYMKQPRNFRLCDRYKYENGFGYEASTAPESKLLLVSIVQHDIEKCISEIKDWMEACRKAGTPRTEVKNKIKEYLNVAEEILPKNVADNILKKYKAALQHVLTIYEAEQILLDVLSVTARTEMKYGKSGFMIEMANEYIKNECCRENFSIDELAEHFQISKSYLSKLYKDEMGESIWNYVMQVRIARAKELLINTDYTNYAIAREIGYSSEYHFSRAFSKIVGVPPTVYKKMYIHQRI